MLARASPSKRLSAPMMALGKLGDVIVIFADQELFTAVVSTQLFLLKKIAVLTKAGRYKLCRLFNPR